MIAVLLDQHVDHDPVAHQPLLDDPRCQRSSGHTALAAVVANPLLAPRDHHKVLRRFQLQMFAFVVADRRGLLLTVATDALLGRAGDHPLTRGRDAGRLCRPGCGRLAWEPGRAAGLSRSPSASTSAWLTPGSCSSSSNCRLDSFSLPGQRVQPLQAKPLFQQLHLLLGVLQLTKLVADNIEQRRR